ncbi:MAG: hypothetical protein PHR82_10125 [Endomicrobiaceae bacterium]|nr:hypothetical protein [Endomicrobiaceae bacterium]
MSRKWKVVVEGGADNLYYVSKSDDVFYVYKTTVGWPFDDNDQIGKTDSLELAIMLIKQDSGDDIDHIEEV